MTLNTMALGAVNDVIFDGRLPSIDERTGVRQRLSEVVK